MVEVSSFTGDKTMQTPWGQSDGQETISDGIVFHSTPGHGGIHLNSYRQKAVKQRFPDFTPFVGPGPWYEEDRDIAVVMLTFPYDFPAEQVLLAYRQVMKLGDDGLDANWLSVVRWLHTVAAEGVKARAWTATATSKELVSMYEVLATESPARRVTLKETRYVDQDRN